MPDLIAASLAELVDELQSRAKASLIALVPKVQHDTDNPEDNLDLFCYGNLRDKAWLVTALQATVAEDIQQTWTPRDEEDDD